MWQDFAAKIEKDMILLKLSNIKINVIDIIDEDNQAKYKIENLTINNYDLSDNLQLSGS